MRRASSRLVLRRTAKALVLPVALVAVFALANPLFRVAGRDRGSIGGSSNGTRNTTPSTFDIWYGDVQTFGQHGEPQRSIDVLGNVQDPDGLVSLAFTLNGGAAIPLTIDPNGSRLQDPGDFDAEIDWTSLVPGANRVRLTATDVTGDTTSKVVTVNDDVVGPTSPTDTTIDWSTTRSIQDVAQAVDGKWRIRGDAVRTEQIGYDRLLAVGDAATWKNYDVTSNITIHSMDPGGGAVGIVAGWQGHRTDQYGTDLPDQPRTGHPFPAYFAYSGPDQGPRCLNIFSNDNRASDHETYLAKDVSGTTLTRGVTYTFKAEVTENDATSSRFRFKVWPTTHPRPVRTVV